MKYGLIGKTLVHSYSKEIHEALEKYEYGMFSLSEEEMLKFVGARDFGGLNVTIPYKQDVIPLCDEVSELAQAIGAVNTLYWSPAASSGAEANATAQAGSDAKAASGANTAASATSNTGSRKLIGHNTDYEGFLYAAKRAGIDFSGKTTLILGTGGTSLMARKAVSDSGASKIFIASRSASPKNADSGCNRTLSCPIEHITYEQLPQIAESIQVIVNTTPVGTFPGNMKSVIDIADFPGCHAVMDAIYNPFKTKLLLDAEKRGLRFSNGLPMLVAQATAAAGYFLGTPGAFDDKNEMIIDRMYKQMRNIVLIGMPGSGKSTIGKHIAEMTGKRFVDMDDEIVKRAGMSIPDIFSKFGEKHFRDLESETAFDLGKERGLVIATGGGAVLRPENTDALRQNGLMVHLLRPVSSLPTNGRPLSKDKAALEKMEAERLPIYEAAADVTFDNSKRMTEAKLKAAVRVICD